MRKLKIYLDTSVINFLYVTDSPEYRKATEVFFERVVVPNKADTYISHIVVDEISKTGNESLRETLLETLAKYDTIRTLVAEGERLEEIAFLGESYIRSGIIPPTKVADSLHIAYSVAFQMDILLSWNFQHLANVNKERRITILNETLGYNYPFRMANPLEVYYEE